jgi:hypothetical protein
MAGKKISQLSSSLSPSLTGHTVFDNGSTTFKTTLQTLRNVLVDSGSHNFTGSQVINGNLTVSGSITAQSYILSSSVTHITVENISGSSNFGDSLDDKHTFTGSLNTTGSVNITGSLNLNGLGNFKTLIVGTGSLDVESPEALHVEVSGSYNIARFDAFNNSYAQLHFQNRSSHNFASTDIVATANNGSETNHFIDLGINSENYNGGFVGYGNDAYLLNVGKDLYVGTVGGSGHPANLKLFAENLWEHPQMTISGSRQIAFNTGSVSSGYTYEFSGSVKLQNELSVDGSVTASYFIGDGSQLTNLPGVSSFDRLTKNDLEVILDATGSLNTPLLLPTTFTADLTEQYYSGPNSGFTLNGEPWSLDVAFQVGINGTVESQVNNIFPILNNPGYATGDSFEFGYSVHGISGYTLTILLNNVVLPGGAGWTANIAFTQPPQYPSTIKSLGAIKLTSNDNDLIFGTLGDMSVPGSITSNGATINEIANLESVVETIVPYESPSSGITHSFIDGSIIYVTGATSDILINITNVPTTNNKAIGLTVMIEQGSTAYDITSLQINSEDEGPVSINWYGGNQPSGIINSTDIFAFSLIKVNSTWRILGQKTSF